MRREADAQSVTREREREAVNGGGGEGAADVQSVTREKERGC